MYIDKKMANFGTNINITEFYLESKNNLRKKKVPNLIKIILKFVLHTTVIFKNRVISPFLNMTLPIF